MGSKCIETLNLEDFISYFPIFYYEKFKIYRETETVL